MKTFNASYTLLLAAILVPLAAAQFGGQSCADGRLCRCRSFLDDKDYKVVQRKVKCYTEVGRNHHFLPQSQEKITREVCQFYKDAEVEGASLMKCIFKDVGMIVNVNGVDQWDLDNMRMFFIEQRNKELPGEGLRPIRTIVLTTYYVCPADRFDFSIFPFEDCWQRAVELLKIIAEGPNTVAKSLPLSDRTEGTPGSSTQVSLSYTYDRDTRPNVDLSALT